MKRIRNSRAARLLSWILTWVMVLPLLCGVIAPRSASAQQPAPAPVGNQLTVMIIDFGNKTSVGGNALARFATDAVAVELASSQRFEVLRREEVAKAADALGYRAPYDKAQLSRIAQSLGATAIVTGEVAYAAVNDKRGMEKSVDIGLEVRVMDPTSGELINGGRKKGTAVAKPGFGDTDMLGQEAVGKAAVYAVRDIIQYTLPEGTILNTVGSWPDLQVLLNRGSRDGVLPGQDMIVMRDRTRVARIKVTNVFPTDSEAKVTELGLGVRPTDSVRAVFPMSSAFDWRGPGDNRNPNQRNGNPMSTIGKFILVIGLAILVATALKSGGSVTGVTAEADFVSGSPAVQIRWRDNIFAGNTLEYHIWRNPDDPFNFAGIPVAAVQLAHNYTDFPTPYSYWDGNRQYLQAPGNVNQNQQNGGVGLAAPVTPAIGAIPGFVPGRTYVYSASAVIRRAALLVGQGNGGGGQQNVLEDVESNPVNSGPTTPINPPLLDLPRDPAANVNLAAVNFSWLSRSGADTYQMELSTDRTFTNRNLIVQLPPVFSTNPSSEGAVMTLPGTLNLTTNAVLKRDPVFQNFVNRVPGASRPTVYWRVGGRNSGDRPGPVDWFHRNTGDMAFRFIYSQPRSFTPADLPPPPP